MKTKREAVNGQLTLSTPNGLRSEGRCAAESRSDSKVTRGRSPSPQGAQAGARRLAFAFAFVAGLALGAGAAPVVGELTVKSVGDSYAEIEVPISDLGDGATQATVAFSYGEDAANLDKTYTPAASVTTTGTATLTLRRLLPERTYFVTATVTNDKDGSATSASVSLTTLESPDNASGLPGLYQTVFTSANGDWTKDYTTVSEGTDWTSYTDTNRIYRRELGAIAAYATGSQKYTSEIWKDQIYWKADQLQWCYWGYMQMKKGTNYKFRAKIDDCTYLAVTDPQTNTKTVLINDKTYSTADVSETYTPTTTGWYPIEIRLSDGSGGKGGCDTSSSCKNSVNLGYSADNGSTWNLMLDDGTGSLFRTGGGASIMTSERVAYGKMTIDLSFLSSDSPRTLAVVWGPQHGGETTNGWAHAEIVGTVAAGETTYSYSMPSTWGDDDCLVVRFCFVSDDADPTWSSSIYWQDLTPPRYQALVKTSGYAGSSMLANFPVLVSVTNVPGFAYADCKAGGADLSFVAADGVTVLPYEIDTWNPEGESLVWVKVPSLAKDTTFTMRWGDASPASVTASDVWTDYVGVWHLDDAADTAACANSSPYGATYDATPSGIGKANQKIYAGGDAPVGRARCFSETPTNSCLVVSNYNATGVTSSFTVSTWIRESVLSGSVPPGNTQLFWRKTSWNGEDGWFVERNNANYTTFVVIGSSASLARNYSCPTLSNSWVHVTAVYNGGTGLLYCNGVQYDSAGITAVKNNDLDLTIGGGKWAVSYDECRFKKGAASADWVKAEYDTMTKRGGDGAFLVYEKAVDVQSADPQVQQFALDGLGGDTLEVTGSLGLLGGDDATSCTVVALVGESEDAMTEWAGVAQTLDAAGAFALTLAPTEARTLVPDATYYVAVKATSSTGASSTTAAKAVKMSGAATWKKAEKTTVSGTSVTFTGQLASVGMTGAASVELWAGTSADALERVEGPVEVTSTAEFTIAHKFDKLATYYWQLRVTNKSTGGTSTLVVNSSDTPKSFATQDTAVYTWKTSVAEGAWEDAANWEASQTPNSGYPKAATATAKFAEGTTAVVTLTNSVTISVLSISSPNVNVTLRKGALATSMPMLTPKSYYSGFSLSGQGSSLTFDAVRLGNTDIGTPSIGSGFTLSLVNGATMDWHVNRTFKNYGGTLRLAAGTRFYAGNGYWVSGGSTTCISNATLQVYYTVCWNSTGGTADTIRFEGETPLLTHTGYSYGFYPDTAGAVLNLDFFVPKTGYASAPYQGQNDSRKTRAMGSGGKSGTAYLNVHADGKVDQESTPLVRWHTAGINTNVVKKGTLPNRACAFTGFEDAAPITALGVTIRPKPGLIIFLR